MLCWEIGKGDPMGWFIILIDGSGWRAELYYDVGHWHVRESTEVTYEA